TSRLVLVSLTYILVLVALYLGAVPYRLRDFFSYIYEKPIRARLFGITLCGCSLALIISSLMY
ncbi:MAG: hypothetical protein IJF70_06235, partial [Opitutales bacterium]|nr:hypothetical protein [Opitutales bacterium]